MGISARVLLSVALVAALAVLLAGCGDSSTSGSSSMPSERAAGPGDKTAVFQQALDMLVDEGTITAEQEEAVLAAIAASRPEGAAGGAPPGASEEQRPGRGMMFSGALDELVDEGTLTSAQAEAVLEALSASRR